MINKILKDFMVRTEVSTATLLGGDGSIIASENKNISNNMDYLEGINKAWSVINKLAKEKNNNFDFYKNIEFLSFQFDDRFNNISYGVLIKAITKKAILLTIFQYSNNFVFIISEFKKALNELSNYYLDNHSHIYI